MAKFIVSKFGGTSMGSAANMIKSANVCLRQGSKVVAVSATSGTTNDLISLGRLAETKGWDEVQALLDKVSVRHLQIAEELKISLEAKDSLNLLLEEISLLAKGIHLLKDCSVKAMDTLMSFGERMSSLLFSEALKEQIRVKSVPLDVVLFDVRLIMRTDDSYGKARSLTEETKALCEKYFLSLRTDEKIIVTQGFIGMTEEGVTTTLGRGGSDYSAAILAESLGADTLEIWTDVSGIATTDPRICPAAKALEEISFKEASELATFGAKILHPATLLPAIRKNIPVFVGSSFDVEAGGTWVRKDVQAQPLIRAMALRKNQVLLTLSTPEMLYAHGFLFQIFKVFNDHKVSIDAITTSEISVSVTLENTTLVNKKLVSDLSQFAEVKVEDKLSLVSLIGNNINHTPNLAKRIFDTIEGINVRMICLGASKHNFCFLVAEENGDVAVQRLHKNFIEESEYA